MGFDLNAFLGRASELRTWKTLLPSAVVCELGGDLGLVPITGELFYELRARLGEDEANRLDGAEGGRFYPSPSMVEAARRWASEASASTTVAYVSIGEFGDMSHEEVTLWSDSQEMMSRVEVQALLRYFYNEAGFGLANEPIRLGRYRGDDAAEKWAAAGVLDDLLRQADDAITALAQALRYEHRYEPLQLLVRTFAANRLAEMGSGARRAIPALIEALKDESWMVRLAAAEALGRTGAGSDAVTAALTDARNDKEPFFGPLVRGAVLEALGRLRKLARPRGTQ